MKKTLLIPAALFLFGIGILLGIALDPQSAVEFKRADDGTPCYTYKGTVDCNFARANKDTQFGEFPYAD